MFYKVLTTMAIAVATMANANLSTADTTRVYVRNNKGNPVANAKVILSSNERVFLTDQKGKVKLRSVPRSSFVLIVDKNGYASFKKEFDFTRKRQHSIHVTLDKKHEHIQPPTVPPSKKTQIKSLHSSFSLYGSKYWRLVAGDGDVWTDKNKFTHVSMELDVKPKGPAATELELSVKYQVWEGSGGDGTLFQGVHKQRLPFTVPAGMKIVGLQAEHSKVRSRNALKFKNNFFRNGKVHGAQSHQTPADSFVKNLNYTIDSFRFDNEDIGLSGTLHILVHLQER